MLVELCTFMKILCERNTHIFMNNKISGAVGVFDSGLGGLTSVRELSKILPDEKIIYFGDTGRVPYGTRSKETITKYALDDMNFLVSKGVKMVLVACGTVSSIAISALKQNFDIPVLGVVSPSAKKAVSITQNKKIAVLATTATIKTGSYEKEIQALMPEAKVMGISCPMFVPLVENGYTDTDNKVTQIICDQYISKLCDFAPDTIILGCTHYPIIKEQIAKSAEKHIGKVNIVDSGKESALCAKEFLSHNNLLNTDASFSGQEFFVSDETPGFKNSASLFLGKEISGVTKIDIEKYMFGKVKN